MYAPRIKEFALTPSHHRINYGLYFNYKDDIKYYLRGAESIFYEHEEKFYCTPDNLNNFIQDLYGRLQEYRWDHDGTVIA